MALGVRALGGLALVACLWAGPVWAASPAPQPGAEPGVPAGDGWGEEPRDGAADEPGGPSQDPASDEPAGDDFDFGDDDEPDGAGAGGDASVPSLPPPPSPWALTGSLRSDWALWAERLTDDPFAKGRQSLDLSLSYRAGIFRLVAAGHAEYDLAYLVGREDYGAPTLDAYEWQLNTREVLVALSPGDFEVTVGRQIVAWGEGDTLSPLDVVNPRDLREPGLADLDDLRLPVLATRVAWFHGAHRVELMAIHEADFGYRSPPLGPFSPFRAALLADPLAASLLKGKTLRYAHRPARFSAEGQQLLGRWVMRGEGVDLGAYAAWVLDRQGALAQPDLAAALAAKEIALPVEHRRYGVLGTSGAVPLSSFVLKWEAGVELGRPVNVGTLDPLALRIERADLLQTMLGLTWKGSGALSDLLVALEVAKPVFLGRPKELLYALDDPMFALRATYDLLSQRMHLLLAWSMVGWQADQGWLLRGQVAYDLADALSLTAGFITYQPGDDLGLLSGLDRHDRVFLRLRWDFQLL